MDQTIRLWDLRTNQCQALLRANGMSRGRTCADFDPTGAQFCVLMGDNAINTYDTRNLTAVCHLSSTSTDKQGPISALVVPDRDVDCVKCRYIPGTQQLLVTTNQAVLYAVDPTEAKPLMRFTGFKNDNLSILDAVATTNGQFIMSGSEDGSIYVWRLDTGELVHVYEECHPGPVSCLQWNPRYLQFTSACTNLAFWAVNPDASVPPSEPPTVAEVTNGTELTDLDDLEE